MAKLVIWTARVDYQQQKDELVLNTTAKSAEGIGKAFKPTWDLVMKSKRGEISWEQYTARYLKLLRTRWSNDPTPFIQACEAGEIVLMCYCSREKKGKQCHRYLLKDVLMQVAQSLGIEATYEGEVMTYRNKEERQEMRHARNKKRPLKR